MTSGAPQLASLCTTQASQHEPIWHQTVQPEAGARAGLAVATVKSPSRVARDAASPRHHKSAL